MASRKLTFRTSDGVTVEVDEYVAVQWQTIKKMVDGGDFSDGGVIPLPNVTGEILLKVIEYSKKHAVSISPKDSTAATRLHDWDFQFVEVDAITLFHLMMAADYLNIQSLLDLTYRRSAHMLKGHSVECIRKILSITNE